MSDFAQVITAIDEIRRYKARESMSLGKELENYSLEAEVDQTKYGELIRNVGRIKNLASR